MGEPVSLWSNWRDFTEKLALLIIGFFLTSLVGQYLAEGYKRESARSDALIAVMQSDVAQAMQVFQSISSSMDRRIFRMRRLHDVFSGAVPKEEFEQRRKEYREALIDWNDNLNKNLALYAFHFDTSGDECSDSLEAVQNGFIRLHAMLQALIDGRTSDSAELGKQLNDLNPCLFHLDQKMLRNIESKRAKYLGALGAGTK